VAYQTGTTTCRARLGLCTSASPKSAVCCRFGQQASDCGYLRNADGIQMTAPAVLVALQQWQQPGLKPDSRYRAVSVSGRGLLGCLAQYFFHRRPGGALRAWHAPLDPPI
jgi:hypothetical protein